MFVTPNVGRKLVPPWPSKHNGMPGNLFGRVLSGYGFSIVNWKAFPIFLINWYDKMFDGGTFPRSLDEELFNSWLAKGRTSNLGYKFLLVIWDEYESNFRAEYTENRESISEYDRYPSSVGRESLVAAYDLYSESRIV